MSKKKKSFTVEEIREYQEVRTERNFLVHGEIRDLKNQVVQIEKNLRGAKEKLATKEMRLKELTATLKKYNDLENSGVIPQAEPQKKIRQPKVKESIKTEMFLKIISGWEQQKADPQFQKLWKDMYGESYALKGLRLNFMQTELRSEFGLEPKSVSNFFKKQFEGEELAGGSKNRTLILPLKKTAKQFEEIQ
tara:strand:- start:8 stop:583 length:576 start_codon:yes stop_codon:yes gene_type:complete